jgi:hypothetical protein
LNLREPYANQKYHVKRKKELTGIILRFIVSIMETTSAKVSLDEEDLAVLEPIKQKMAKEQGKVSNIAAVRFAIRLAARELESK